jgi:peptide/nickel transport system substrate-binding protein
MLTLRYLVRLIAAFLARFKGIFLISIALGILAFVVLQLLGPTIFSRSTEKIGITGRYRTDNLPDFIIGKVGDGLTKLDKSGVVEPSKEVTSDTIGYDFSDVEIELPDEKTIVFKLQNAFSPFPTVVSKPTFKKGLLGTGAWRVKNITVAGGYVQELILTNKKEGKIIYRFYPTEERAKLAYKLGQIDTLINIYDPTPLDTWKTVKTTTEPNSNQVISIFFNVQDKFLSDKTLRQALVYAVDKESFDGERAYGPLPPTSWAYNPQVKTYKYDKLRAKELIEELDEEQIKDLEIKLVTTPVLLPTAERITKYWEAIGVKTVLQVSSGIPPDYQALLAVFEIPKDPDQYSIWHSTQTATNISNYQNPRIDKLLEDGREELTLIERSKIYLDFQRFLVEDSPAAFLYHPTSFTLDRK